MTIRRPAKVSGSAEAQIAFTVEKCRDHYPIPVVIICSGEHSERQLEYAKERVGGNLIQAVNFEEFSQMCDRIREDAAQFRADIDPGQALLFGF